MESTEYKIIDILSREIGNSISIHKIKDKISDVYGNAHYPMIYNTVQQLEQKKLVHIDKDGKSSVVSLNFGNPLLIDHLAQVEIINKINFLKDRKDWQMVVLQINNYLSELDMIKSILMMKPDTSSKLNRLELFVLLRKNKKELKIHSNIESFEKLYNIKIDYLILDEISFENLMKSTDANQIKEIMSDKIVILYPQIFWLLIKKLFDKGIQIKVEKEPILLGKISEQDIIFNLARFGYKEIGINIIQGKNVGIEYIITSILIKKNNIRRLEAISIIIAKNKEKINYSLLVFLATKFNTIRQLYNILKILDKIMPTKKIKYVIKGIKKSELKTEQHTIELNLKDMKKKMKLYDVTK